jgi:hypothetical protein
MRRSCGNGKDGSVRQAMLSTFIAHDDRIMVDLTYVILASDDRPVETE